MPKPILDFYIPLKHRHFLRRTSEILQYPSITFVNIEHYVCAVCYDFQLLCNFPSYIISVSVCSHKTSQENILQVTKYTVVSQTF